MTSVPEVDMKVFFMRLPNFVTLFLWACYSTNIYSLSFIGKTRKKNHGKSSVSQNVRWRNSNNLHVICLP